MKSQPETAKYAIEAINLVKRFKPYHWAGLVGRGSGQEVVAVNQEALKSTELIERDPYGKGWLLKIRVSKMKPNLRNLLSGKLAVAWLENAVGSLRQRMAGELGVVMQDGGLPVSGFAKVLSPEKWDEIAAEFFLTK